MEKASAEETNPRMPKADTTGKSSTFLISLSSQPHLFAFGGAFDVFAVPCDFAVANSACFDEADLGFLRFIFRFLGFSVSMLESCPVINSMIATLRIDKRYFSHFQFENIELIR
jgi:hypothetical protein